MQVLGSRVFPKIALIVLPIMLAVDAGSVTLMRFSLSSDAEDEGRAGAAAIANTNTVTTEDAQLAYNAAKSVADTHGETIDPTSFTIYKDGSVTLTVRKSAGTLLFDHLPLLGGLTRASTTTTVQRPW